MKLYVSLGFNDCVQALECDACGAELVRYGLWFLSEDIALAVANHRCTN